MQLSFPFHPCSIGLLPYPDASESKRAGWKIGLWAKVVASVGNACLSLIPSYA